MAEILQTSESELLKNLQITNLPLLELSAKDFFEQVQASGKQNPDTVSAFFHHSVIACLAGRNRSVDVTTFLKKFPITYADPSVKDGSSILSLSDFMGRAKVVDQKPQPDGFDFPISKLFYLHDEGSMAVIYKLVADVHRLSKRTGENVNFPIYMILASESDTHRLLQKYSRE